MSDWVNRKVKDLCYLGRGRVISSIEINQNQGIYPVYSSQSQNNGEMGRINSFDFEGSYVTWTTDGAYAGTVFYRQGKFNCTNVCGTLKQKNDEELDLKFLSYLLSTVSKKHVSYVGNPKLMNGIMAEIQLHFPSLKEEQIKIATIISTLDKAIAATEQLISKYQRIKTGLLHDLLTCGIDEHGNLRSEKTHQFKNSPLGRIPVEWEAKTLGEINHFITSGSRNWARFYSIEGALFLRITNLIRENINFKFEDIKRVNIQNNDEGLRTKLQEGDILISITADLGIIGVIPDSFDEAYINQHIALYRILERENYNSRFLGHFLSSWFAQEQFVKLNDGGAKAGLNLPTILKIKIPKIDINEQEIISARLDKSDALIVKLKSNLSKLQSLKTGLMQDLLSGKVRVNSSNEKEVKA